MNDLFLDGYFFLFFCFFCLSLYYKVFVIIIAGLGDLALIGEGNEFYKTGPMGVVAMVGVDQTGQSDSNSDVSAAESVATNRSNLTVFGENENNRNEKISSVAFIDFLGIGAN